MKIQIIMNTLSSLVSFRTLFFLALLFLGFCLFIVFGFLVALCGFLDLSSPTRD